MYALHMNFYTNVHAATKLDENELCFMANSEKPVTNANLLFMLFM